jgi:8-oxo-dGTP diphosphatase
MKLTVKNYKGPFLTVDAIITKEDKILLIKRKKEPFRRFFALPGGFIKYGEMVEQACQREIREETGLLVKVKGIVGVYSHPGRDPRGHIITICFETKIIRGLPKAKSDAAGLKWMPLSKLPKLAFDHNLIIKDYIGYLTPNT